MKKVEGADDPEQTGFRRPKSRTGCRPKDQRLRRTKSHSEMQSNFAKRTGGGGGGGGLHTTGREDV